jgi:FMN-dependent NADH-azoreductase
MADINPAMAELMPLAAESLSGAPSAVDQLWGADENAA